MTLWAFVEGHPIWSIIALIIVTTMVETIGTSIAAAIGRRR
jgi:hypothetical protein